MERSKERGRDGKERERGEERRKRVRREILDGRREGGRGGGVWGERKEEDKIKEGSKERRKEGGRERKSRVRRVGVSKWRKKRGERKLVNEGGGE